jgi:hypothetical protein
VRRRCELCGSPPAPEERFCGRHLLWLARLRSEIRPGELLEFELDMVAG